MQPITDTDTLAALCTRLRQADFVTIDTEFLRDNTYYSLLCLVQLADDEGAAAVDPLANGLDLTPLFELLDDPSVLKVMHACRQDMEIFYQMTGHTPKPVFDTQIAATVCGFGESVGYETLVTKIAREQVDKTARYTDWSKRPLSDTQIDYALGDVTHLRVIYRHLSEQLRKTGREDWVAEDMAVLTDPALYEVDPETAWQRIKIRSNKPRFLALVQKIAAWREREAQRRNLPRNRVLKDDTLLEIAAHGPSNVEDLDNIRGLARGFSRSSAGKSLFSAIEQANALPADALPRVDRGKPRNPTPPMADLLKVLLKIKCQEAGVAPRMVASAQDIESWAADPAQDFPGLHGWRRAIFGEDALKLLDGSLALTVHGQNIDVVELEPED